MQGARTGSHSYSILQGKRKRCYFTDTETGSLERHHIYFGAGMRQISDKHGFWVWLKPEWHRGTSGVHGRDGHKVDLRLIAKENLRKPIPERSLWQSSDGTICRTKQNRKKRKRLRIRVGSICCRRCEHGQRNYI